MTGSRSPSGAVAAGSFPLAERILGELHTQSVNDWPKILGQVRLADVAERLTFDPQKYTRTLLAADDGIEILLMGWLPGQASVIHDHGESQGAAVVLAGHGEEDYFEAVSEGRARHTESRPLQPGDSTIECRTDVHRVVNRSNGLLVTLHAYGPRLTEYRTYEA